MTQPIIQYKNSDKKHVHFKEAVFTVKEEAISVRDEAENFESTVQIVITTLADSAVQVGVFLADKSVHAN